MFAIQVPALEHGEKEAEPSDLVSPGAAVGEKRPEQDVCASGEGRGKREAEGRSVCDAWAVQKQR